MCMGGNRRICMDAVGEQVGVMLINTFIFNFGLVLKGLTLPPDSV